MKKLLRSFLCLFVFASMSGPFLLSQTLQTSNVQLALPQNTLFGNSGNLAARGPSNCGPDTVLYGQFKATGLPAISLNSSSSADKLGQYFNAPQAITIQGFSFFSWQSDLSSNTPVTLTCRLFNAGLDSLPFGNPLATGTVVVDTNFYGGSLAQLRKTVNFNTPITVTGPYVLTVETVSGTTCSVVCNDWGATPADGFMEWLGMASLVSTGWLHGYELNVGVGTPFDCDVLLQPHINYDISSNFSVTPSCFTSGTTATFTNTSSSVLFDRMYNVAAFVGNPDLSFVWNYGDASAQDTLVDTTHVYTGGGPYNVELTSTVFAWNGNNCVDDTIIPVGNVAPNAAWSSSGSSLTWNFTNQSSGGATSYLWDFGDGNTSTQTDPTHTYSSTGTYTVCLTATSACGSDSSCGTVTVSNCPAPTPGFSAVATQLTVDFTDAATGTGTLTYLWDFGDGNTSTLQSPSHTYAIPGTYTVCQTVTDNCGTDSTCSNVTVTCPVPSSGFTYVTNNRDLTTTNTSIGGNTFLWTFGDGNTSTDTSPMHTYAADGIYEVCLISTNPCGSDTTCISISVMLIGMEDAFNGNILFYPNPATSQLTIDLDLEVSEEIKVEVYSLLGDRLLQSELGSVLRERVELDLSSIENGIYLVRVSGKEAIINRKIQVLR